MAAYSRRDILKLGLLSGSATFLAGQSRLLAANPPPAAVAAKPDSRVRGVHIGLNVPYSFRNNSLGNEAIIANCVKLGVSAVELRSQPVELALGLPPGLLPQRGRGAGNPSGASREERAAELNRWRLGVSMDKVAEIRRQYEQAGVFIEIVKFDGIYEMPDNVTDYCFHLAKALGARAISCEISVAQSKRLGQFADKHRLFVGYHNHATVKPADWETVFSHAEFNGANVDIGHFVAGNDTSVVDFLKKHHARVTHVHIKDRKRNEGPNMPFGEGDTPIADVLRLIRDNRWPIQATIEYEYPVPPGSDVLVELAKTVQFCRTALNT